MLPTSMPDITPAQVVALVKTLLALAAAFGLSLSGEQTTAVLALVALIAPAVVLLLSDAHIRGKRAEIAAARAKEQPLYDPVVNE